MKLTIATMILFAMFPAAALATGDHGNNNGPRNGGDSASNAAAISGSIGGMHVGMPCCKGGPEGRKYGWHWSRRNEKLCESMGAWASFPNAANNRLP